MIEYEIILAKINDVKIHNPIYVNIIERPIQPVQSICSCSAYDSNVSAVNRNNIIPIIMKRTL
tara:strand:+ start:26 stop:214 length:189 start_codon:yes stop_codon:yes gene_type:complete